MTTHFVYAKTAKSGVYEVSDPDSGRVDQMVAVNLLDRVESDLAVREELKLGYEEIKGKLATAPARRDYWTWLVPAGLGGDFSRMVYLQPPRIYLSTRSSTTPAIAGAIESRHRWVERLNLQFFGSPDFQQICGG